MQLRVGCCPPQPRHSRKPCTHIGRQQERHTLQAVLRLGQQRLLFGRGRQVGAATPPELCQTCTDYGMKIDPAREFDPEKTGKSKDTAGAAGRVRVSWRTGATPQKTERSASCVRSPLSLKMMAAFLSSSSWARRSLSAPGSHPMLYSHLG